MRESLWLGRGSQRSVETTIGDCLRSAAERHEAEPALIFVELDGRVSRRLSYGELLERAERVARGLLSHFEPGERIAVWSRNCPEWLILEFATALAGLTLITVNPAYGPGELSAVLERAGACAVFWGDQADAASVEEVGAASRLRERVELATIEAFGAAGPWSQRLPRVRPQDAAQIQHTSGTTGQPKAVLLSHGSIMARARIGASLAKLDSRDRMINPMPMFHTSGCNWMALGSVISGAAHVLLPRFEPRGVLGAIESQSGTTLVGFATMLQRIVEEADNASYDVSSIRYVVSGGTSVPTALARRIEARFGARLSVLYGMTECSGVITQTAVEDLIERVGTSVGRPFPETDLKIIDPETGRILPVGELGELCVRGELVMREYVGMSSPVDEEGWFHTGDFGSIDADGYCSVEGRRYDLILRDGRFLSPRPIEERLAEHPAVAEVVVVALDDDQGGKFVATVRPFAGTAPSIDELRAFVAPLGGVLPERWVVVDRLPLTVTGKVHRYQIHEELARVEA